MVLLPLLVLIDPLLVPTGGLFQPKISKDLSTILIAMALDSFLLNVAPLSESEPLESLALPLTAFGSPYRDSKP